MSKQSFELPSLKELHHDPDQAFKGDKFKLLLYQQPPANWIKQNEMANNSDYMPIEKVEYLLDRIFQRWKVEVLFVSQLFNAVHVTVRLHYLDPQTGEWAYHDGVGAQELQTRKNTGKLQADLSNISHGAVTMALPIAKSKAIKDAADHIGPIFGRNLNRKDVVFEFVGAYSETKKRAEERVQQQPPAGDDNYQL